MADNSAIEWTDATVNPIRARVVDITDQGAGVDRVGWHCEHVSEGCRNCYSEAINGFRGTLRPFKPGERFRADRVGYYDNGEVKVFLDDAALLKPLRWRKPRRIFWDSMTDLFGDWVPDDWIDRHLAVMALTPHHTHQILTKRPERMRAYFAGNEDTGDAFTRVLSAAPKMMEDGDTWWSYLNQQGWPLPNVWLGTSVENQEWADRRRDDLAALAAAGWNTFVSYEPALGPVDWRGWEFLRWLISGGESGPKARPSHPDWHRAACGFAQVHGIPYFFKQWGEWTVSTSPHRDGPTHWIDRDGACYPIESGSSWPLGAAPIRKVGKSRAGRLLDGREWNEVPK